MSPKILLEKNKGRENRVSEEKERKRKKSNVLVFSSFLLLFESPILAVTLFKNLIVALIYIFLTLVPNRNLILKGYNLKSND